MSEFLPTEEYDLCLSLEKEMVVVMNAYEKNSNNIIHKSGWAISKKLGNKVYKYFLHDSYSKIQKEVLLLQLGLDKEVILSFDAINECWVCESEYMELRSIVGNIYIDELVIQLKNIFETWENNWQYRDRVADEWAELVIPWYCMLLQRYIPNSNEIIDWLQYSRAEHFIHGDFTLSNIYLDYNNKVIVLDYENATLGPLLWDETTLVYSFIEQKQFNIAKQLYDFFNCTKEMLRVIDSIRFAQSLRKKQNIKRRSEAHEFITKNY